MDGTAPPLVEGGTTWRWVKSESTLYFSFRVVGTPRPKARPRFRRTPNFVQTYTPATTVNWEQTIVAQVKEAMAAILTFFPDDMGLLPFSGRIIADVRINCARPKSAPKSVTYPMKATPGDVDNLAKSVLDALQLAGVIEDDKTVTDLSAYKRFADDDHPEGVEVELIAHI